MKYRKLGKTELRVSTIGIGTHQFGGAWGKDFSVPEVTEILNEAKELGMNLIDTAACYGYNSLSEELIGKSIKGNRDHWIVATKFGRYNTGGNDVSCDFSVGAVAKQLETSLRLLGTDYIDLYQFHSGTNDEFNNQELWSYLQEQVRAGKIRYLGISLSGPLLEQGDVYQIENIDKSGAYVVQTVYNRLNDKAGKKVFPLCMQKDIGVLARIPLAKGFLSGNYKPGTIFPTNDNRADYAPGFNDELLRKVEIIKNSEVPAGVNMAQWAISWCLNNSAVSAVIPGCKSIEQMRANAAAADLLDDLHPLSIN